METNTPDTNVTPRVLTSVKAFELKEKDAIVWDDGSLEINDWEYDYYDQDPERDHLRLTNAQARKLRKYLNKPGVKQALGIGPRRMTPVESGPLVNEVTTTELSARLEVATWENGEVTLEHPSYQYNNRLPHFILDEEEAYKLYSVLHAHFLNRHRQ